MAEEYRYPNTVELSSRPEPTRYMWVLQIADGDTCSGMTYNGLLKAFVREGLESSGSLPTSVKLKFIDLTQNIVVVIPNSFGVEKVLTFWRKNYYNPTWTMRKK